MGARGHHQVSARRDPVPDCLYLGLFQFLEAGVVNDNKIKPVIALPRVRKVTGQGVDEVQGSI